jgi:hypothetical protein
MHAKTRMGITLAVWAAASASAVTLAIAVRPPPPLERASPPKPCTPAAASHRAAEPLIVLPPLVIVGSTPPRSQPRARREPGAPTRWHCSDWRALTMGSGSVRLCEWETR